MAFKIVDDEFGQLTFTRIYQGQVEKGGQYYNQRTGKQGTVQPHRQDAQPTSARKSTVASAGDIVADDGRRLPPAATPTASEPNFCTLESIYVAEAG